MTIAAIDRIVSHAARIARGEETVKPGQPARFTEAASKGDAIWQGDLCLEIVARAPKGYAKVKNPAGANRQLVPGNTVGAKHCLDSLNGVTLYQPAEWPNVTELGPCLSLSEERTVLHPTHGPVTIPAGFSVLCSYQKEWDALQRQARRNAD